MNKEDSNFSKERPLFSFCLFAYNQEKFIREAIEGALNQTYSPLEIILSDDCSTDNTFVIMQEMSANYDGIHKIILNRNVKNLGMASHYNKVVQIAKGDWLCVAAGDDISMDFRIETAFNELMKLDNPNKIKYIGTAVDLIRYNGHYIGTSYFDFSKKINLPGCMAIYSKDCFELFPPLDNNITSEDFVLPFRALMLGEILIINKSTVKYRQGTTNDYLINLEKYLGFHKKVIYAYKQRNIDLNYIKENFNEMIWQKIKSLNNDWINLTNNYKDGIAKKESILMISKMEIRKRIHYIIISSDFNVFEKVKLFLDSFKWVRILKGNLKVKLYKKYQRIIISPSQTPIVVNMDDILTKKFMIVGYNNIDFNTVVNK